MGVGRLSLTLLSPRLSLSLSRSFFLSVSYSYKKVSRPYSTFTQQQSSDWLSYKHLVHQHAFSAGLLWGTRDDGDSSDSSGCV